MNRIRSADPDKDNYLSLGTAVLFLKELQMRSSKMKSGTETSSQLNFAKYFIGSQHPVMKYTVLEILLWLLQMHSGANTHSSELSDDMVVVERVMKTVYLVNYRHYDAAHFIEAVYLQCLVENLELECDPSILRLVCRCILFFTYCCFFNPLSGQNFWNF